MDSILNYIQCQSSVYCLYVCDVCCVYLHSLVWTLFIIQLYLVYFNLVHEISLATIHITFIIRTRCYDFTRKQFLCILNAINVGTVCAVCVWIVNSFVVYIMYKMVQYIAWFEAIVNWIVQWHIKTYSNANYFHQIQNETRPNSKHKMLQIFHIQSTNKTLPFRFQAKQSATLDRRVPPLGGWPSDQVPGVTGLKNHGNTW